MQLPSGTKSSLSLNSAPGSCPFQKMEQQCCSLGWVQTHHKSIIGKAVAALDMFHEVGAAVAGVSPRHGGTYGTNLPGGSKVL